MGEQGSRKVAEAAKVSTSTEHLAGRNGPCWRSLAGRGGNAPSPAEQEREQEPASKRGGRSGCVPASRSGDHSVQGAVAAAEDQPAKRLTRMKPGGTVGGGRGGGRDGWGRGERVDGSLAVGRGQEGGRALS